MIPQSTVSSAPSSANAAALVKMVRIGVLSSINKIDPRDAVDYVSAVVLGQVFDTPYTVSPRQTAAKPVLFDALRREDQVGAAYSAAVRPGICFSDGTALTPEIAVRSLRNASVLKNKVTVDVREGRIFFALASPNPRFDLVLTQSSCGIVLDKGLQLLGTGPYMFDHRPNLRLLQGERVLRLVRNPHHPGKAAIDEVHFIVHPPEGDGTPRRLIEALRNGEVDVTTVLSAADVARERLTGMTASMQAASSTAVLFMNTQRRPLTSREVRRGIACAIDLHAVASAAYDRNPAAFVAGSVLPPSMGRSAAAARFERQQAVRLLEESGAKGASLSMVVPWGPRPYLPRPMAVATSIQKQLEAVGISLSIVETKSSDDFFDHLYRGRFDLALAGWIADTPDPADYYEALLWSQTIGGENHSNYGRWRDPETDAAIERFRSMPVEENRQVLDGLIREQAPFVPLVYGQSTVLHSRKLRNVEVLTTGLMPVGDFMLS